jgi:nucleoside-diphosphate-sugar epimerase
VIFDGLGGHSVLVTGASGFIGSHLCRRLLEAGADVHGTSRRRSGHSGGIRWWQCDLADADTVGNVVGLVRPAVIYHLGSAVTGARDMSTVPKTFRHNLVSSVNLLMAAAESGKARFIYTGSMEEGPTDVASTPCSPYAAAKQASVGYLRMFHALYGVPAVHLRLAMVYGPAQRDLSKLVPYVTLELLRRRSPRIGSGSRLVDWVFVGDVVDALLASGVKPGIEGESIDIGCGELQSVRSVVEHLNAIVDPEVVPNFGAVDDRPLEAEYVADVARTQQILDWRPMVPLNEGLRRTARWYGDAVAADRI